ncbi:hypothetical protein [Paraburkholderia sp. RL17-337-BIB-A]
MFSAIPGFSVIAMLILAFVIRRHQRQTSAETTHDLMASKQGL